MKTKILLAVSAVLAVFLMLNTGSASASVPAATDDVLEIRRLDAGRRPSP